jgi:hypothetical protein
MRRRDVLTGAVALAACTQLPKEAEAVAARAIALVERVQPLAGSDVLTDQDGSQITDEALMAIVVDKFQ